jgi:hypothetical protein
MKEFEKDYRKWSRVALISIVMFLFTIATIDAFLGFDFSKNMYLMSIVATGCVMSLISLTWIRILNCKLMRTDLVEPAKPAHQEKVDDDRTITPETIEMCIRKEGYVPQVEEGVVSFKIAGEIYEVYYLDEKFTILKKFGIGEDIDKDLLLKACSQAHDEIFMFRSYTHTYDNDRTVLCFETETYVHSTAELERYFPQYLNVLNAGIERQREIYHHLVEDTISSKPEAAVQGLPDSKVVS